METTAARFVRIIPLFAVIVVILNSSSSALAQSPNWTKDDQSITHPTVEATLSALTKRRDLLTANIGDWVLARDVKKKIIWAFTKPALAAHPSVVRETVIVGPDGTTTAKIATLCEAIRADCELLMADYKKLISRMKTEKEKRIRKPKKVKTSKAGPTKTEQEVALQLVDRFLAAIRVKQYREAYNLTAPVLKKSLPYDRYVGLQNRLFALGGGNPAYISTKVFWYRNPQNSPAGLYAVVEIVCTIPKKPYCKEIVTVYKPPNGRFTVLRQNRDFVDPATESNLRQENLGGNLNAQ